MELWYQRLKSQKDTSQVPRVQVQTGSIVAPPGGSGARQEINTTVIRSMRRERSGPGTTENRPQIMVLLRNSGQIAGLLS